MIDSEHPLQPKGSDGVLRVIILTRLSQAKETVEENAATMESSATASKEYLERVYSGQVEYTVLSEQISGMVVDRETIPETYALVETGTQDLVLCEELRCVYRNPAMQILFVQNMYDSKTRFISIADSIDTATDDWESMLLFATTRHGLVIPDTRRRSKRKSRFSFNSNGMVLKVRFGYRKLTRDQAATGEHGPVGHRMVKIAEADPIWSEIRARLLSKMRPQAVVDWLIEAGVKPGPYVSSKGWTPQLTESMRVDLAE